MKLPAVLRRRLRHARRFSERGGDGMASVHGVEIFASGTHRGQEYTDADLDDMVRNFRQLSSGKRPLLQPPAVIGHEDEGDGGLMEASDLPAVGWPKRLWKETLTCPTCGGKGQIAGENQGKEPCPVCGGKGRYSVLKADLGEVPESIARLIESHAYRKISAEVYDDPPEGLPGKGKTLRRIALLGGELPQVKSLADIPRPRFGEAAARYTPVLLRLCEVRSGKGYYRVFSEVRPMNPDEMKAKLQEAGWKPEVLATLPEPALVEACRMLDEDDDGDEYSEEEMNSLPDDKKKEYGEKCKSMAARYADLAKKCLGEMPAPPTMATSPATTVSQLAEPPAATPKPPEAPMQTPTQTTITHKYNEQDLKTIAGLVAAELKGEVAAVKGDVKQFKETLNREHVQRFCEHQRNEGRVTPAELDTTSRLPTLVDDLMRLDDTVIVHRFKEGRAERTFTERGLAMERIKLRKAKKDAEKVGTAQGAAAADDAAAEQLEQHFETYAETFRKTDPKFTKEKLVAGYKAAKARNAELTVEKFLSAK